MDHKSGYSKVKHLEKKHSLPLTKSRKNLRFKWTKDHVIWNDAWHKVICSVEQTLNLDGSDSFSYSWHDLRKEEEIFQLVLKVVMAL